MRITAILLLAAVLTVTSLGCAGKFTKQRFDTVYIGAPSGKLLRTLGRPDSRDGDTWTYTNNSPWYQAKFVISEDSVADKKFSYDRQGN